MPRGCILFAVVCITLATWGGVLPHAVAASLESTSISALSGYLLNGKGGLDELRARGPFAVMMRKNHELPVSATERVNADLFLPESVDTVPLVIFLHGHDSSKEAHASQAVHLASWGISCLVIQLPNNGPWIDNGRTLATVVNLIHRQPRVVDGRTDPNRIILAGHSFGGSAVAIALAEGAGAVGAVLLDPAAVDEDLPLFLNHINTPVMLLGADERVTTTLNRDYFYRFIPREIAELSIKDATHEDAQYPSEPAVQAFETDPGTTEALQITFASALTAAALSLASTGRFEYAWASFADAFDDGTFFNGKRK